MQQGILRFTTAGHVDDGKSTLIGRLLLDSRALHEDHVESIQQASARKGKDLDLALFTDGLRAEREQGITVDVAYRYFSTAARKFILADAPGHFQFTRNLVTAASTADLVVILVDARTGPVEQTIRHASIAALMGISNLVVCINKMDLVGYSKDVFGDICNRFHLIMSKLGLTHVSFIPISALHGDNVVVKSMQMPWYHGKTLMELLETVTVHTPGPNQALRLPVQGVLSDSTTGIGRLAAGSAQAGDEVIVYPGGERARIASLAIGSKSCTRVTAPMSVSFSLDRKIQLSRGSLLAASEMRQGIDWVVKICWMRERPLRITERYLVRHTACEVLGTVISIAGRLDLASMELSACGELTSNDIGMVALKTDSALVADSFRENRTTGSLLLVDPETFETVAAGFIE